MPLEQLLVPEFSRLADYVGVWAIEPLAARAAWDLAKTCDLAAHVKTTQDDPPKPRVQVEQIPIRGGTKIAVVKMAGLLMKAVPSMSAGTSTVQLRREIRQAAADPAISGILLAIDSPGGTAAGTDDLARDIRDARKIKPVWAQIEDLSASAAYWIAAQAEKVYANSATALVGSIGTMMTMYDLSSMAEKMGVKTLVFATGVLKGAGEEGTQITEEQAAYFQAIVNDTQRSFDDAVKRGRRLTDKQLTEVRSGAIYMAEDALGKKLIDGIQSLDATLDALTGAAIKAQRERDKRTSGLAPAQPKERNMTFENWLEAQGFVAEDLSEKQLASMRTSWQRLYPAAATAATAKNDGPTITFDVQADFSQARQQAAAESQRIADVRRICAREGNPTKVGDDGHEILIEAKAIADGWNLDKVELECLRAKRPAPVGISKSHENDCTAEALQGALLLRAGGRLDHPAYQQPEALEAGIPSWLRQCVNSDHRQRVMEAAHQFADMSLVDICREALRLDGREAPRNRSDMIRAAFSGSSMTNIFTTNVNTIILATYSEGGDTTQEWTRTTDVADFKTNERPRLVKGAGLAKLPRGSEADHVSRSDVMESYKIGRYAGQFVVDEQDIVDDAFNALSDIPIEMGRAAARLRPDLVYAIILANPTLSATSRALFNSTDGNDLSAAALAAATLRTAVKTLMLFRENSINLNLMPTHILVPPSLRHLAYELTNSSEILVKGSTDAERGNINALAADGIRPVGEARLENGVTDPASGTAYSGSASLWYLVSNQAQTIEVAYLRGTGRAPQVRSFVLTQGKWGMGWDVNLDIGAKAMDWRGMVKN